MISGENTKRKFDILPALLAFLTGRLFFSAIALFKGIDITDPKIWSRWDAGHYLSIATKGYEIFDCAKINYPGSGLLMA